MKSSAFVSTSLTLSHPVACLGWRRLRLYWQLSKPRVTLLVWFSGLAPLWVAAESVRALTVLSLAMGLWCIVAAANAFNQIIEWPRDALMSRTANRPIPSGVVSVNEALWIAFGWTAVGLLALWFGTNALTTAIGAFALATYVLLYTPLKPLTSWSTVIGAVTGATPPVMGFTAVRNGIEPFVLVWFLVQFVWQFPHFWAIAWRYQEDYARAGFRMLPALARTARQVGWWILGSSVALTAASLLPVLTGWRGGVYAMGAALLGAWMLRAAWRFVQQPTPERALSVILVSVGYLPIWMLWMLFIR